MRLFRRRRQTRVLAVPASASVSGSVSRSRKRGSLIRRASAALVALGLLAGTFVAVTMTVAPVQAWPDPACAIGGGSESNLGPERLDAGSTAWLPRVYQEDVPEFTPGRLEQPTHGFQKVTSNHTLWEVAGARGLLWSYSHQGPKDEFNPADPEGSLEEQCSPVDASAAYLGQLMFEASRFFAGLTIGMKQLALGDAPFKDFYGEEGKLVRTLRDYLFIPAISLGVVVTGIWVLTRIRRRDDARETYGGVLGSSMLVVLIVALLVGNNFQSLTEFVDDTTSEFNKASLNLLSKDGPDRKLGPCHINEPKGDRYQEGQRRSSCMLYEMLLYNPWVNGQFGTTRPIVKSNLCYGSGGKNPDIQCRTSGYEETKDYCQYSPYRCLSKDRPTASSKNERCAKHPRNKVCINIAVQQVIAQSYTRNETLYDDVAKAYGPPRKSAGDPDNPSGYHALWKGVQYAVAQKSQTDHDIDYAQWKGAHPGSRMATAISSAIMNLIVFIAVGVFALLVLFWHGVFFVAWILIPVVAAVAIFPPARRIVKSVAGVMVQAIFLRNVLGLLLVVLLGIMNAINISHSDTALKIILMIIAAAAILRFLKALQSGQMAPTIVQSAAEHGMLPSGGRVVAGAGTAAVWARRQAGSAVRQTRATVAGATEGYRVAQAESPHEPGTKESRRDAVRGAVAGAQTGRRTATEGGRTRVQAERWARAEGYYRSRKPRYQRDLERRRREEAEESRRARQAEQEEARWQAQAERDRQRHDEIMDRLPED